MWIPTRRHPLRSVFDTEIPKATKAAETSAMGFSIFKHDPNGKVAEAYWKVTREVLNDAATILMVDSNLQRETLLPSERAFAFKMKFDAMKRQGERRDLTSVQVAPKLTTQLLGEESGMSKDNVKRYVMPQYRKKK